MIKIEFDNMILRDMIESDIEDYVRWFTVEREWENWDAPWEKEHTCEQTERKKWAEYYESVKDRPEDTLRQRFEIEWNGKHIGWVSSYCIDENYEWIGNIKDGQTVHRAMGIDICEPDLYGNGIGTNALRAFMNYYFEHGVNELYTQTWSGNVRMLRCAEKLGFVECDRDVGTREVDGQKFDGLTFKIKSLRTDIFQLDEVSLMEKQIAALATDDQHIVMWDIDSLLDDIAMIPSVPTATSKLKPQKWLTIDKTYALKTDYTKPIVLFELPEGQAYIADGNHRLYHAIADGVAKMNVVLVSEKTHLKYLFRCTADDYYQVIRGLMSEHIFIDRPF